MALLTFVYVVATLWLVILSRRQLTTATNLEKGRTRPFVIFDLIVERHFVFAVVKNTGMTSAKDVKITVTPNIKCLLGGKNTIPKEEKEIDISFIERGVAMLTPERSITALVGHWSRFRDHHKNLVFEGQISYLGSDGTPYSEAFAADLSAHEGLLYLGTKTLDDVAKQLEKISQTMDHIASGFKKPIIRTITEKAHRKEEDAQMQQIIKTLEDTDKQKIEQGGAANPLPPAAPGDC